MLSDFCVAACAVSGVASLSGGAAAGPGTKDDRSGVARGAGYADAGQDAAAWAIPAGSGTAGRC